MRTKSWPHAAVSCHCTLLLLTKMNKLYALLVFACAALAGQAQTLQIHLTSGETVSYDVADVAHIDFSETTGSLVGDKTGTISVMVGGTFGPYVVKDLTHTVTANADGTLDVTIPEYHIPGTPIGNLVLSTFTVRGLTWDDELQAYVHSFTNDGIIVHFQAVKDGNITMEGDYEFNARANNAISLSLNAEGKATMTMTMQVGNMPFPIAVEFTEE